MVYNSLGLCLAYVDIAFSRWDIATKVYELVYYWIVSDMGDKMNKTCWALLKK